MQAQIPFSTRVRHVHIMPKLDKTHVSPVWFQMPHHAGFMPVCKLTKQLPVAVIPLHRDVVTGGCKASVNIHSKTHVSSVQQDRIRTNEVSKTYMACPQYLQTPSGSCPALIFIECGKHQMMVLQRRSGLQQMQRNDQATENSHESCPPCSA